MIYLDTSVALAHLLAEDRRPPEALWDETLVSSRLLEYELWTPLPEQWASRFLTMSGERHHCRMHKTHVLAPSAAAWAPEQGVVEWRR